LGGYALKYATNRNLQLASISVNANAVSANAPTRITFTLTPTQGVISEAYLATACFGHNYNPLTIYSETNQLVYDFGTSIIYTEYIANNAVFHLTVKWE
jgi:hypothetical protein